MSRRKEATENRRQQEKPIMPDREDERMFETTRHHSAVILQFESQSADPKLDQPISETDQAPRPPSVDFQVRGDSPFTLYLSSDKRVDLAIRFGRVSAKPRCRRRRQ